MCCLTLFVVLSYPQVWSEEFYNTLFHFSSATGEVNYTLLNSKFQVFSGREARDDANRPYAFTRKTPTPPQTFSFR